jgi:hypothetical protein
MASLTVTVTDTGGQTVGALDVKVLTGAAAVAGQNGQTAVATISSGTAALSITPNNTGSWVYGGQLYFQSGFAGTLTANGNTAYRAQINNSNNVSATLRSSSTTTAATPVSLGATNNSESAGVIALAEIIATGTLAEDASAPATVTGSTTSLTTASFTPAAGLIVVMAAGNAGAGTSALSISDSFGLTWTLLASREIAGNGGAMVWIANSPNAATAGTPWPPPLIPPGMGSPMAWQDQEPTWLTPQVSPPAQTPQAAVDQLTPPGFMSPMAWQDQTTQYNPQIPPTQINFTDSAAAVDAESAPAVAVSLADPVAVADLASGLTFPPFTDAAGVVESIQITVPITLADAVAVVDSVSVAVAVTFTDAAGVTDLASARTFPYPEAAGVTDAFAVSIGITLADVAAITDLPLPTPVISAVPAPPWTPPAVTPGRVLWGTGILLTAPSGTAVPSDQNLGVASAWLALGWTYVGATVDGVQISYAPSVTELSSAEGTPLAEVVTAADVTISVALSEETLATIALATGNNAGVAVTAAGAGQPGKQVLSLSTTWPTMAAALIGLNQLGYARVLLVPSVVSTGQMAVPYRRAAAQRAYPVTLTATCPWTSITWTDLTSVATS